MFYILECDSSLLSHEIQTFPFNTHLKFIYFGEISGVFNANFKRQGNANSN